MAFGGLNIKVGTLNKRSILTGIVNLAETLLDEKTAENEMAKTISKKVMRDPQIEFLLRSFTNRYNLYGADIRVAPEIQESSLVVDKWALLVDNRVALSADGLEELNRQITEYVLTTDTAKINELVAKLEACLK